MKPGRVDLPTIWRGCSYAPIFFHWKDHDGQPFDLSGYRAMASARSFDFNLVITDYRKGIVRMNLYASRTNKLKLGTEHWDWIWINNITGSVTPPLLSGSVEIKQPLSEIPPPVPAP